MSVQRFVGKTSRAVLKDVRTMLGDDAVIISNRTTQEGVEVLAMAADAMDNLVENAGSPTRSSRTGRMTGTTQHDGHITRNEAIADVEQPAQPRTPQHGRDMRDMLLQAASQGAQRASSNTSRTAAQELDEPESFESYLRRARGPQLNVGASVTARGASSRPMVQPQTKQQPQQAPARAPQSPQPAQVGSRTGAQARAAAEYESVFSAQMENPETLPPIPMMSAPQRPVPQQQVRARPAPQHTQQLNAQAESFEDEVVHDEYANVEAEHAQHTQHAQSQMISETPVRRAPVQPMQPMQPGVSAPPAPTTPMPIPRQQQAVAALTSEVAAKPAADAALMSELKSMKGMLQNQLAQLAFSDMSRKNPVQGKLLAKLMQAGFSAVLARTLVERIGAGVNEESANEWLATALTQNLRCAKSGEDIVDRGGIHALVGPTGVGKTTTTAKLAARCVMKYGAKKLGLITIDSYRIGAQDQLKTFGKMLGVAVHIAHDQASLNDLLVAMRDRHLVIIDTVGMPQRDPRMSEQLNMLMGPGIERVMVLNAASQAETLEEVVQAWIGPRCRRALITKMDEAAKLGGVVDAAIRHQLTIDFVTNGQRVPEDIHAANASLLVHRALRANTVPAFQFKSDELILAAAPSIANADVQQANQTALMANGAHTKRAKGGQSA
jgi:flagellar biosynthesis protein FlhF